MNASDLEKAARLMTNNADLSKKIEQLKKVSDYDMGDFKLDHNSIERIAIPRAIAKKIRATLIQQYTKTILDNRASVRLLGVNPDA
jgi:hypothetical protein